MSVVNIEKKIGLILLIGTLLATFIVAIGGSLYLLKFGHEDISYEVLRSIPNTHSSKEIWQMAFSFTPLGIVQFGLLVLVATQFLRVLLLCFYYIKERDVWFSLFCGFISLVLAYSFLKN